MKEIPELKQYIGSEVEIEMEYPEEKKIIKGEVYFFLNNGEVDTAVKDYTEEEKQFVNMFQTEYDIYDLMTGEEFANCVETHSIMDYDGTISNIFVNDYKSNLGIWDYGMHQGKFCVSLNDFRKICEDYDVEVNWANK